MPGSPAHETVMLREKIKAHNEVNGFLFSVIEFALIAAIVLPFAGYYFLHARVVAGLVASGIACNALTIAAFGLHSLRANQQDIGISKWFERSGRETIRSKYPNLTSDTLVITSTVLLPFVVLLWILFELSAVHGRRERPS